VQEKYNKLQEEQAKLENKLSDAKSKYINVLNDEISAVQEQITTYEQDLDKARSEYISGLQNRISTIQDEINTYEQDLTDAKSAYINKLQEEQGEIRNTISSLDSLIKSLSNYHSEILLSDESPLHAGQQARFARAEFMETADLARRGNQEAMEALQEVSQDYISSTRMAGMGEDDAFRDVQKALNATEEAAKDRKEREQRHLGEINAKINSVEDYQQKSLDQLKREYEQAKRIADHEIPLLEQQLNAHQDMIKKVEESEEKSLHELHNIYDQAKSAADTQIPLLKDQLSAHKSTLETLKESLPSLEEAQKQYSQAKLELDKWQQNHDITWFQEELARLDNITNATLGVQTALGNYQSALVSAISSGYENLDSKYSNELDALRERMQEEPDNTETTGFASGGTVSGPNSGYSMPVTFHGTEHITPDSQMKDVKVQLQEIKQVLSMMLNTSGDQKKYAKKMWQILDGSSRGDLPLTTEST
jgi:DNA repair exonuclease SbcCD ATPase subunit